MKAVVVEKPARHVLRRMQRPTSTRIIGKIQQYARHPEALAANVKSLAGDHRKRLRVGDWRVLFVEDELSITVLDIRPRGSAYK